jgi:hypothetical protein
MMFTQHRWYDSFGFFKDGWNHSCSSNQLSSP